MPHRAWSGRGVRGRPLLMLTRHVLVTGAHRSGTTWVGRTLAHHPSCVYVHEPFNVSDPNQAFGYRVAAAFYYVPGSAHEACIHAAFARLLRAESWCTGMWASGNSIAAFRKMQPWNPSCSMICSTTSNSARS